MKLKSNKRGFTLLEVLLVVAIIAILAGIVILALNPARQLSNSRDSQRWVDINTILNAVYQYSIDNGAPPTTIPANATEICKTGAASCVGLVDLAVLTTNETYLVSIPNDPQGGVNETNGAGYHIRKTGNNRVTVNATKAEEGTISVTR